MLVVGTVMKVKPALPHRSNDQFELSIDIWPWRQAPQLYHVCSDAAEGLAYQIKEWLSAVPPPIGEQTRAIIAPWVFCLWWYELWSCREGVIWQVKVPAVVLDWFLWDRPIECLQARWVPIFWTCHGTRLPTLACRERVSATFKAVRNFCFWPSAFERPRWSSDD